MKRLILQCKGWISINQDGYCRVDTSCKKWKEHFTKMFSGYIVTQKNKEK